MGLNIMNREEKENSKKMEAIKREAKIKTIITFGASISTVVLSLLFAMLVPSLQLKGSDIIIKLFSNGTLATIVLSHLITFFINSFEKNIIFYNPKFWKAGQRIETSEVLYIFGAMFILVFSIMSYISYLDNSPVNCWQILFSIVLLLVDARFTYNLSVKREYEKIDKYSEFDEALSEDQNRMREGFKLDSFEGGKL